MPRLTTRRLMVIIALIGAFLGGYLFVTRRVAYRQRMAQKHQFALQDPWYDTLLMYSPGSLPSM